MSEHESSQPYKRDHQNSAHGHSHTTGYGHTHNTINPSILTGERGIWSLKWSFIGLLFTTLLQAVVVVLSGSVALLADTIHNLGDSLTAIPLAIAFALARRKPSKRFSYGYGRVEDLAGVVVVLTILASAIVVGYESINRFFHPKPVSYLWAVVAAAIIGFLGNEGVAVFRMKIGKEIGSAALVADGYHARVDGWASLSVLFSVIGVWLGYPLADPIIGLLMTALILRIVSEAAQSVFTRLLDGVNPEVIDEIKEATNSTSGIEDVTDVRVRWLGHRLQAELNITVSSELSVGDGHELAMKTRHELLHKLPFLSGVIIHIDPTHRSGEEYHRIVEHEHNGLPSHSHA